MSISKQGSQAENGRSKCSSHSVSRTQPPRQRGGKTFFYRYVGLMAGLSRGGPCFLGWLSYGIIRSSERSKHEEEGQGRAISVALYAHSPVHTYHFPLPLPHMTFWYLLSRNIAAALGHPCPINLAKNAALLCLPCMDLNRLALATAPLRCVVYSCCLCRPSHLKARLQKSPRTSTGSPNRVLDAGRAGRRARDTE